MLTIIGAVRLRGMVSTACIIAQQALGIVKFIESRLMSDDFADVSWTLKNLALSDSDQDALSKAIKSIDIPVRSRAVLFVCRCPPLHLCEHLGLLVRSSI